MKNLYHLLLCAVLAMMSSATWAQTFTVDDLTFTVTDADAKTVSVKKTAATTGDLVIPSSVTNEEVTYTVTSIPGSAFASTGITSITIPASVMSVEGYAFRYCNSLTAITIEDSEIPLAWNGSNSGEYHPLYNVDANYTLYLGRDLATNGNRCYFKGATSVEIGPKVTTINANLFDGASKLGTVTMGNGVTTVGASAFRNTGTNDAVGVQSITLGANVETIGNSAFSGCSKLVSLNLGTKLTAIPEYMLASCTALTGITIPASVQSVNAYAFNNCNALTSITINDSETPLAWNGNTGGRYDPLYNATANYTLYLGRDLTTNGDLGYFKGATSVEIGPKVTAINANLFDGASKLGTVTMGNGVTTVGASAFRNTGTDASVGVQSITLGANVDSIGNRAFSGCSKLVSLNLGSKLTAIPDYMLNECAALTSITIPASVQSVGPYAFQYCHSLTAITIEDSEIPLAWNGSNSGEYHPLYNVTANYTLYLGRDLATNGNRCYFKGATSVEIGPKVTTINANLFDGASKLGTVTMGNGVTTIGAYAFRNTGTDDSVGEQSITLGTNVETIGSSAFSGCTKLTSIDLGSKLTAIPKYMLNGCTALTSITIPASVMSVEGYAFQNCDMLTSITIEDSETALAWNGDNGGTYDPLYYVDANYTLYLGRNLTTNGNRGYFKGATSVEIGDMVTSINNQLFYGSTKLASVTMGSGVTNIGSEAFRDTGTDVSVGVQSITLGANVETIGNSAFSGCSKLVSLNLGTKLTAIPESMLASCTALTGITIPASVQSVNAYAFNNCNALTSITINDSETPLAWNGNSGGTYDPLYNVTANYTLYIGRDMTTNGNRGFFKGATSVEFGPQVTTITPYLLQSSSCLASINMTNATNLTTIGAYAFDGAGNDDSVGELSFAFGNAVTTIGARAFNNCNKISSITIPANVTTIEASAFWNMKADITVTIEDSETPLTLNCEGNYYPIFDSNSSITAYVGRNILRTGKYANQPLFGKQLTSVTIGPKVTAIGDKEYYDCDGLPTVSGMENVESIGASAFKSCSNLTSVELGTKLATMGDYAFQDCQKLESIVIPGTLKVIPVEAFENCFALASVTLCEGIEEIGNGAFYDTDALTEITIPASVKKIGRAPFYCNNTQAMTRMIIADSDEPLEFANGTSEYNWGRGNLTDDITLDYFYLGRDVNRVYFEHSLVYGAKEIEIGPKVTTISETKGLFYATDNVESVKVHHLTPIAINDADFSASIYANATLLVPAGTTEAYAAADGWKKFTNVDYWSTLVTLTASAHGSIVTAEATASNGSEQFHQPKYDPVVYTLNADNGYELTALTDNGNAVSPLPELGAAQSRANDYGEELVTLAATFTPITYTITYDLAGGTAADGSPATYTIESENFTLVNPTRNGYTFSGWTGTGLSAATKTVTIAKGSMENRSYTATWTPIDYAISYELAGGAVATANRTTYNIETATFTLNNPTREGYTFAGWTGTDLSAATTTVSVAKGSTGERSYTANWTPITYNINYDLAGGTAADGSPVSYTIESSTITLPQPTRNGYTFAGWTGTDLDAATTTVTIAKGSTGNKAYTATWTPVTYTISYNLDGGTAADGSPYSYTIESDPVTLLAPTKEGHIFAGWTGTDVAAATLSVTIPTGSTGNRSYTATWEKATYTVTIEGDAQADNTKPEFGDNVTITIAKDEDRTLTALTVDGVNVLDDIDEDADGYTYVIRNISADVIVVATFVSTKEFITMDDTYATFSCTQALDFSGVSGLKAYIASGYSKNSGDVLLTRVESVPANTGLILVSTEKGVTYKVPYADSDAYYVNLLKAVDETKTIPQEEGGNVNFLLERRNNSFGFYKSEGNTTLGAGKAYLQVPSSAISSDVKSLRISFGDILVPVQGLKAGAEAPDGVYDLNGRTIPAGHKLTRGVYIVNGKKIAIK